ncbi:MAG TPA: hypothetical protein VGJ48_25495 [Pyrinomonadaceae bacterium]
MTKDRLSEIRLKVERAIKHIDDLAAVCKSFIDSTPYSLGRETDPTTGYYHFGVNNVQTPPVAVGLIAGDAIHNLRSALDHVACHLVLANGNTPSRQTCFPIFDSAAKYQAMDARKVRGMSQGAIDAIDAAKPYKGGNEALYTLHELDIADKHHSLLATLVSVTQATIDVPGSLRDFRSPRFALPNFQEPLKDGDVFFICEPGVENDTKIAFDVGLCEPEIIKGKPIVRALGQMVKHVNTTIISFEKFLV